MSSSDHHKKKKKRSRRHDADDNDDYPDAPRKSLVDYSKVSERPSHPSVASVPTTAGPSMTPASAPTTAPAPAEKAVPMSSQMQAVVRLMTGQAERTIQEKLADSNRPTWEQYKKDNHDKLNLEGVDQKEMEEYRRELDTERDSRLARGTNHNNTKKKKKKRRQDDSSSVDSDDDYSDESRRRRRKHKKHKKKHKRSKKEGDDDSANDSGDDSRRKRRKKKHKKKRDEAGDGDSDGSAYRLSNFFTQGSDDDDA